MDPTPDRAALARKRALRKQLLRLRRSIAPAELAAASAELTRRLLETPEWSDSPALAAFVGVRGEVDTLALLRASLEAGKRVYLPRLTGPGVMRFWACEDLVDLEPGPKGLLEPRIVGPGLACPGPAEGVKLMLVPGLGFDRDGARLGFGAGYYDRAFTAAEGPRPLLCGVCLARFVDAPGGPIPVLAHDRRMQALVTEAGFELL